MAKAIIGGPRAFFCNNLQIRIFFNFSPINLCYFHPIKIQEQKHQTTEFKRNQRAFTKYDWGYFHYMFEIIDISNSINIFQNLTEVLQYMLITT